MSTLDKIVAAVSPPESEGDRREARAKAESVAGADTWLAMALDHHRQIEQAFEDLRGATDSTGGLTALKQLALILNGHSVAEEIVLYPALVDANEKRHSTTAYTQQSATKVQMALLEQMTPGSKDWQEKLEHIRGAVLHHMYEEENDWFMELHRGLDAAQHARLTERFQEEFERYVGGNALSRAANRMGAAASAGRESAGTPGYRH